MRFDHFGMFVDEIWAGYADLTAHVPIKHRSFPVDDAEWGAQVLFAYDHDGLCYEIIEAEPGKPARDVSDACKSAINHVAYRVSCLDSSLILVGNNGGTIIVGPKPALGGRYGNTAFVRTKSGLIMELIEETPARQVAA